VERRVVLFSGVDGRLDGGHPWVSMSMLTIGSALQAAGTAVLLIDPQVHEDWQGRLTTSLPGSTYFGVTCMTGPSIATVV